MVQRHVILRKRANPKTVNLPNGRSFVSKWERISRKQLPMTIKINRVKTVGARRNNCRIYFNLARDSFRKIKRKWKQAARQAALQQSGQGGLGSEFFKTSLKLGSKVL